MLGCYAAMQTGRPPDLIGLAATLLRQSPHHARQLNDISCVM